LAPFVNFAYLGRCRYASGAAAPASAPSDNRGGAASKPPAGPAAALAHDGSDERSDSESDREAPFAAGAAGDGGDLPVDTVGLAGHTVLMVENDLGEAEERIVPNDSRDCSYARDQLRGIVEDCIAEATVEAASTGKPPAAQAGRRRSPHVLVPERGLVSTQLLVAELNHVGGVSKLDVSKDRLTRVTHCPDPDQQHHTGGVRASLQVRHTSCY
jgi:hypothetical protein